MPDINKMAPRSGRILKEDGTVINIADAGLPVQLTGSNASKTTIETAVDAVSVSAGGGLTTFTITPKGESEIYFAISIDQAPWNLRSGWAFFRSHTYGSINTVLIDEGSKSETFTINNPCIAFYYGLPHNRIPGVTAPTTLEEAKKIAVPPLSGSDPIQVKIENMHETEIATVTVRIMRVWR